MHKAGYLATQAQAMIRDKYSCSTYVVITYVEAVLHVFCAWEDVHADVSGNNGACRPTGFKSPIVEQSQTKWALALGTMTYYLVHERMFPTGGQTSTATGLNFFKMYQNWQSFGLRAGGHHINVHTDEYVTSDVTYQEDR